MSSGRRHFLRVATVRSLLRLVRHAGTTKKEVAVERCPQNELLNTKRFCKKEKATAAVRLPLLKARGKQKKQQSTTCEWCSLKIKVKLSKENSDYRVRAAVARAPKNEKPTMTLQQQSEVAVLPASHT